MGAEVGGWGMVGSLQAATAQRISAQSKCYSEFGKPVSGGGSRLSVLDGTH